MIAHAKPRQIQLQPSGSFFLPSMDTNPLIIDTETTGGQFFKPYPGFDEICLPFLVAFHDCHGKNWSWEFYVDPYTRRVEYDRWKIKDMLKVLKQYHWFVFHNAKFDIRALSRMGDRAKFDIHEYIPWDRVHDTLPASHVCDSLEDHSLKTLALKYFNIPEHDETELKELVVKARTEARKQGIPIGPGTSDSSNVGVDYFLPKFVFGDDIASRYCHKDTQRTVLLWLMYCKVLKEKELVNHYMREREHIRIAYEMEEAGLTFRPTVTKRIIKQTNTTAERTRIEVRHAAGNRDLNPNSSKQLRQLLYEELRAPIVKRTTISQEPSTDAEAINLLLGIYEAFQERGWRADKNEMKAIGIQPKGVFRKSDGTAQFSTDDMARCKRLLNVLHHYEEYASSKTLASYANGYEDRKINNELHGGFNPWGTSTTRYSSSDPNMQNATPFLRDMFGPQQGYRWYALDYNQLEIRLMAKASGDPTLLRVLNEGIDQHQVTCDAINDIRAKNGLPPISRRQAKNINFAWQYGAASRTRTGQPGKLARMAGIDADSFDLAMQTAYPGVVHYMKLCIATVERYGYINTLFGYPLQVERGSPYKGTNYSIQGTAGCLIKNAMIDVAEYIRDADSKYELRLLLMVHDELVISCHKNTPIKIIRDIAKLMSDAGKAINCVTPVNIKRIATGWGSGKAIAV